MRLGLLLAAALLLLTAGPQVGRGETQVSPPASLWYPAWSPDGSHVAWAAVACTQTCTGTVWIADSSGRNARPLHAFQIPGDSFGQIAWETPTSLLVDVWIFNTNWELSRLKLSGAVTPLAHVAAGRFSLDRSRWHAAVGDPDCPQVNCSGAIQVVNLRSGTVRQVAAPADDNLAPSILPDGRRVIYERYTCQPTGDPAGDCTRQYEGIWLAPISGRERPRRLSRSFCPVLSPNGKLLATLSSRGLSVRSLHAAATGPLARVARCLYESPPAFSPNSRSIAYQADLAAKNVEGFRLAAIDLRSRRFILHSPRSLGAVDEQAWSPDGSKILVVARYLRPFGNPGCLYVATVATRRWRAFRPCN